jgi:rRNA maturation RNase YbeY
MIRFSSFPDLGYAFEEKHYRDWIKEIITGENKLVGDIYYIFTNDENLYRINKQYLNHDTLTDIITFPFSENENVVSGEIYISVERVDENSKLQNVEFENELSRVLAHGVLHLLGYDDRTEEEKAVMRQKEDYYISLLPRKNS